MANRLNAHADMAAGAAVCCIVLAALAAEAGDAGRATELLDRADRLNTRAGRTVPAFQVHDVERVRALTS